MAFFKELVKKEEKEFRQWAWDNYKPMTDISGAWHFVVQEECAHINRDYSRGIRIPTVEEIFNS